METAKKKSNVGKIIAIIVILAILAAVAIVGFRFYTQYMQEKEAAYQEAEGYLDAGNCRDAYKAFLALEGYEDAADRAQQVQQQMADEAQAHMALAQHLSDLKFNTVAGLYLTEVLNDGNRFTLDDYNQMATMIGPFYDAAQQQYEEAMLVEEKMTLPVMEILMPRIEALEESKDPDEGLQVLSEITAFSLADQVFFHCWSNGTFANTSLDAMAEMCPQWVPVMDQIIVADEEFDVMEVVGRT